MIKCQFNEFDIRSYYEQEHKGIEQRFYSGGSTSSKGTTTPQATPEQMAAIYNQYLPSVLATASNQNAPVTNSMAGAAANANPIYTASGLNQLNSYAPGYANSGNNLTQQQS